MQSEVVALDFFCRFALWVVHFDGEREASHSRKSHALAVSEFVDKNVGKSREGCLDVALCERTAVLDALLELVLGCGWDVDHFGIEVFGVGAFNVVDGPNFKLDFHGNV